MKVLKVIHGYPMRYNAGSEVYSQMLCHALAEEHEVRVFTREEDPFAMDFAMRTECDELDARVLKYLVNVPRSKDRYRHVAVDQRFAEVLDVYQPHVVHVGHLNHLSTSLLTEAAAREIPIVYTLHDYWVMCPRGQFMQFFAEDPTELWAACDGQEHQKCAERCYARYFSGSPNERAQDVEMWSDWVARRMAHMREMVEHVDLFIAPSKYLYKRYRDEFGLSERKLEYLDYGFDLERLKGRVRVPDEPFTFGYIGTHIPAKGINHLIEAFGEVNASAQLRIWGRPRGQNTAALKAQAAALGGGAAERIEWLSEYRNEEIVEQVFNKVDAIVVPSVWVENSPLVIHEAIQAGVPVITADVGGMAEHIEHEVNGLLFRHRDPASLAAQMQRLALEPALAEQLGAHGFLHSESGDIPSMNTHVRDIEAIYKNVLELRDKAHLEKLDGPWRITFDTNPDTCNMRCIMCEEHSQLSDKQTQRRKAGKPRRIMSIDLIRQVLEDSRGTALREIIPSTMGEPLLYEHFDQILDMCEEFDVQLNLTTNGTFPKKGARAWAERIVAVTSDVKISWNGATKETQEKIMVGSNWERVLENVRTFIAVRDAHAAAGGNFCRVTFQLTFIEENLHELADIIKLAASLGVNRVKGHHLWVHFDGMEEQSMRRSPEAIRRWNEAVLNARKAAQTHKLPDGQTILLENIYLLDEEATTDIAPGGKCPFLGQEAWISAMGRFNPCCAPDEKRKSLGSFGNLYGRSITDIWNSDDYNRLVRSYRTRELCLGCNMRKPAEES